MSGNITLNGRAMHSVHDVKDELERKGHDLMCPLSSFSIWSPILSTRDCVKSFSGLDENTKYESCRSEELAHRLHVAKMERGVIDLEPIAPAANVAGAGVHYAGLGAGVGAAFYGAGTFLKALKAWKL
jgi:hypothetical protein